MYIKSFGGQKGGSSEPPRTPPPPPPPLPTGLLTFDPEFQLSSTRRERVNYTSERQIRSEREATRNSHVQFYDVTSWNYICELRRSQFGIQPQTVRISFVWARDIKYCIYCVSTPILHRESTDSLIQSVADLEIQKGGFSLVSQARPTSARE